MSSPLATGRWSGAFAWLGIVACFIAIVVVIVVASLRVDAARENRSMPVRATPTVVV